MHELGELLDDGQAALVVIGESRVDEQVKKSLTRARKSLEQEIDAEAEDMKQALRDAEREATAS